MSKLKLKAKILACACLLYTSVEQHTSGSGICAHAAPKASLILGTIERMATE